MSSPSKIFNNLYQKLRKDIEANPLKYLFVYPIVVFFVTFLVIPVSMVFVAMFRDDDGSFTFFFVESVFTNKEFVDFGGDPRTEFFTKVDVFRTDQTWYILSGTDRGIILNSIIIALLTTLLSLVIGISLALFMARREFPGKKIVSVMLLIPLIIPPFIGGMGFLQMFGEAGIINDHFLAPNFGFKIVLRGIAALVFVEAFHYYTLIYLNVYSSLLNIDPSLEEQAKLSGAKGFTLLRTVTLPLALPGIAAGSILTFILSIEDLGTPIDFADRGDPIARKTMTFYIFSNLETRDPGSLNVIPQATAVVGTILLLFALIGFLIIRRFVTMRSYSMISKGREGQRDIKKADTWEYLTFYLIYGIVFLLSIVSHVGVLYLAFTKTVTYPPDWSLDQFRFIFSSSQNVLPFIINTLSFSLIALVVIIIFGTMAAYAIARIDFKGKGTFDVLITIPIALPGVVIGLGYIILFTNSGSFDLLGIIGIESDFRVTLDPFVYPVILLICSYAVRKFPFAVRSIFAGLQQTSVSLEEAAINLGASRSHTLRTITIPLISLNMVAGSLVALVYTISEVSTTLIIVFKEPYGTITWAMGNQHTARFGVFAALGTLLMAMQIVSLIISNVLLKSRAEAMTGI
ncbi:MAG: ABC transporter permease [Candidatus Kariarchaeaceae archaeon]|jgi:ABC-type Fe3+ transport system permease subunit